MMTLKIEKNSSMAAKFKFCFIVQGPPRSGKSTVARHLAQENGAII
jgi:cytidylate kinase